MTEDLNAFVVTDDPENNRLVVERDGRTAELVYHHDGDRVIVTHVGVPEALEGRGIAGALVADAVRRAADAGSTVVPWCPYARHWLTKHGDAAATVTIDWTPPS